MGLENEAKLFEVVYSFVFLVFLVEMYTTEERGSSLCYEVVFDQFGEEAMNYVI